MKFLTEKHCRDVRKPGYPRDVLPRLQSWVLRLLHAINYRFTYQPHQLTARTEIYERRTTRAVVLPN